MSRRAQADREREARIILAGSELKVAEKMAEASEVYERNAHAMQLRAMNMTYEAIKEKGALIIVPSGMVDSMNPAVLGIAASGRAGALNPSVPPGKKGNPSSSD